MVSSQPFFCDFHQDLFFWQAQFSIGLASGSSADVLLSRDGCHGGVLSLVCQFSQPILIRFGDIPYSQTRKYLLNFRSVRGMGNLANHPHRGFRVLHSIFWIHQKMECHDFHGIHGISERWSDTPKITILIRTQKFGSQVCCAANPSKSFESGPFKAHLDLSKRTGHP